MRRTQRTQRCRRFADAMVPQRWRFGSIVTMQRCRAIIAVQRCSVAAMPRCNVCADSHGIAFQEVSPPIGWYSEYSTTPDPTGRYSEYSTTAPYRMVLGVLDHTGPHRKVLGVLDHIGPYRMVLGVLDHIGPYRKVLGVLDHIGPYRNVLGVLDHIGPYRMVLGVLDHRTRMLTSSGDKYSSGAAYLRVHPLTALHPLPAHFRLRCGGE
jgi:hypothetical protein